MESKYPKFDLCLALRDAGFPQKRKFQAMYYVRPDMLICIDDLSALKNDGKTDFENIFESLIFRPTLDDIEEESRDFFDQIRYTNVSGIFAYSNIQTKTPDENNPDTYIRAGAPTEWEARVRLYLAVKQFQNGNTRVLTPPQLDESENKEQGTEPPTNP